MKKYLVSTTTHRISGEQVGNWEGDYIESESLQEAIDKGTAWEKHLLETEEGATDIDIDGDTVFYTIDGEEFYREIHAEARTWYAVMIDRDDTDWGTGSHDLEKALEMLRETGGEYIAVIEDGDDPVCIGEIDRNGNEI